MIKADIRLPIFPNKISLKVSRWDRFRLMFCWTYVHIDSPRAVFFKVMDGAIFIVKEEPLR